MPSDYLITFIKDIACSEKVNLRYYKLLYTVYGTIVYCMFIKFYVLIPIEDFQTQRVQPEVTYIYSKEINI